MVRSLWILAILSACGAGARAAETAPAPPRMATVQDLQLLKSRFPVVAQELGRMGLHQTAGQTCTAFITVDSVRPIETPLPLDGGTVTLPYASFLIWSRNRPYADSLLYHVFGTTDARYAEPVRFPAGSTPAKNTYEITLTKRQAYPASDELVRDHADFAGPFADRGTKGAVHALAVRPYTLPTQSDKSTSVLPRKAEQILEVTCLTDPDQVRNCLCAGTE